MATTSMTLSPHWQAFIQRQIDSGRYASASEVVREALRDMEEREQQLAALRAHIAEGIAQIERGEVVEWDPEDIVARALERANGQVRRQV